MLKMLPKRHFNPSLKSYLTKTTSSNIHFGPNLILVCPHDDTSLSEEPYLYVGEEGLYGRQAVWEEEWRGEAGRKSLSGQ